jgi:hypothetical protein
VDTRPREAVLVEYDRANRAGLAAISLLLGVALAWLATHGIWRTILICAAVVVGLGYVAFGPSIRLELRDGRLVRRFMTSRIELDLQDVVELDVQWVPYGPLQMHVTSPAGHISFAITESSALFRRALGQELMALELRRRCTSRSRAHLYFEEPRDPLSAE